MQLKIATTNHQNKAMRLISSLAMAGHSINNEDPDILLIDHDSHPWYSNIIDEFPRAKVILCPHGANSCLTWDGVWPVHERTICYLAQAPGEKHMMELYVYPRPVHVTGWHWCDIKPFSKSAKLERVLFAPIHVSTNGFLEKTSKESNRLANERMKELAALTGAQIVVRYVGGDLESHGLTQEDEFTYIYGRADNSYDNIDEADLVVSVGTFAYLAVARGKPTAMYHQDAGVYDGASDEDMKYANNCDLYADYKRFPVDVLDGGEMQDVIDNALDDSEELQEWKAKMIGEPFNSGAFVKLIEELDSNA